MKIPDYNKLCIVNTNKNDSGYYVYRVHYGVEGKSMSGAIFLNVSGIAVTTIGRMEITGQVVSTVKTDGFEASSAVASETIIMDRSQTIQKPGRFAYY